jgi:hypothetical protein
MSVQAEARLRWLCALALLSSTCALADPSVIGISYVPTSTSPPITHAGPATFSYKFNIAVANPGAAVAEVVVAVVSSDPSVTVSPSTFVIGLMQGGANVPAAANFTVTQDRSGCGGASCGPVNPGPHCAGGVIVPGANKCNLPFRYGALVWNVSFHPLPVSTDPPHIVSLAFVELGGRPAHEGLMPIPGQPMSDGIATTVYANFSAPLASGVLLAVAPGGATLSQAPLNEYPDTDYILTDYTATIVAPNVPFQLVVQGTDRQGRAVKLLWPTLYKASPVEVRFPVELLPGAAGTTLVVPVRVTNGPTAQALTLALQSLSTSFVASPASQNLQLASNEIRDLTVSVQIPAGMPTETLATVVAFVLSTTDPASSNTATLKVAVQ